MSPPTSTPEPESRVPTCLRVVVCGDTANPHSGTSAYVKALRTLGHRVWALDDVTDRPPGGGGLFARGYERVLRVPWEPIRCRLVRSLLSLVRTVAADVVIVSKGLFLAREDVGALRRVAGWVVNINHDDFFSATPTNWSILQRDAVSAWDRVFVTKEVNVGEVEALGGRAEFLPFAYDPDVHRIVPVTSREKSELGADVLFVGTWAPEREPLFEELLSRTDANVLIFGNAWENLRTGSRVRAHVRGRPLLGDDMAKAIGASKISLGLLRKANRDDHTQRTFEIPACGGVLLAERTERHTRLYREGVEADFFDPTDPASLANKLHALLHDAQRRERMRQDGHLAVTQGRHTYSDRVDQILRAHKRDVLGL